MFVVVNKAGTRIATLISNEIVNFLNFVVLCPRYGRQNTRFISSIAVVMRSLKFCFTSSIFASSVIPLPHTIVSSLAFFADIAPLDGY